MHINLCIHPFPARPPLLAAPCLPDLYILELTAEFSPLFLPHMLFVGKLFVSLDFTQSHAKPLSFTSLVLTSLLSSKPHTSLFPTSTGISNRDLKLLRPNTWRVTFNSFLHHCPPPKQFFTESDQYYLKYSSSVFHVISQATTKASSLPSCFDPFPQLQERNANPLL